ncbi:MAG: 5-(carboxyamino)imidazole ribonucleotide synthase, partial [Bacteroidetes bacterium HGW-Bacteroidetes-12]
MQQKISSAFKLGIIGGGQLGKMLVQAASKWDINTYILDPDENCSAAKLCTKFIKGSFRNYDDVYQFGKQVDLITFEIEHVNIEALHQLQQEKKVIYPQPNVLEIIQDKGLQKQFYATHQLPTAHFSLYTSKKEIVTAINEKKITFPFVQKSRKEGYDGKGVVVIKSEKEIEKIFDTPSVIEEAIAIEKELAVIVAKNTKNELSAFAVVEMEFSAEANLVEQLICPAAIAKQVEEKAIALAKKVIEKLDMIGILAVELFLT